MDFLKKNIKVIGVAACVLVVIGCFLPFASTLGISIGYSEGDGAFVIIATIISAVLILLKKKKAVLIPNIVALLIFINTTIKLLKIDLVSLEIGFYVVLIGLIVITLYPFISAKEA